MIAIYQNMEDRGIEEVTFRELEEASFNINRELIESEIIRLTRESETSKNRYNLANIKALKRFLNKILKNMGDGNSLEICWTVKDRIASAYPIEMISEMLYDVDISEYVEIKDEKLLLVDISKVSEIIAYQFVFRELGETNKSIEEKLNDTSLVSVNVSDSITSIIDKDIMLISKELKIGDSPFISYDRGTIKGYFGFKEYPIVKEIKASGKHINNTYREVITDSCREVATIIASSIIKTLSDRGVDFRLINVNEAKISMIIDKNIENDAIKDYIDNIEIRAFGRRFKVEPKIEIF